MSTYHAFYSQKAHDNFGSIIYDGKQCTAIYKSKEEGLERYKWDDKVYVGVIDSDNYGGRIESEMSLQRRYLNKEQTRRMREIP